MNDYIVTNLIIGEESYLAACFFEEMKLQELRVESTKEKSLVGNVYRGVVENTAKNIHGAFVRISGKQMAFLPISKNETIKGSSPVLVQVTKDAAGIKEPVLTTNIHLSGECAVLSSNPGRTSFSAKLSQEDKALIRKWLRDLPENPYHILIRTNALRAGKAALLKEISEHTARMERIFRDYEKASTGDLIDTNEPFYLTALRDAYAAPDRVFSDIPVCREKLMEFLLARKDAEKDTVFSEKEGRSLTLAELYNLNHSVEKLLQKKVWLKSGAFLVIEQTEAFVSVDVNTGKCTKGRIAEETYRKINLEAAEELARQIRLRNLSGMILVDFINMTSEDHKEELVNVTRKLLRKDHIHTEVIDLTPLGIMEIVRQKVRKPLAEILSV